MKLFSAIHSGACIFALLVALFATVGAESAHAVDAPSDSTAQAKESDEELMQLLEYQSSQLKAESKKSSKQRAVKHGLSITLGRGWEDNVFHASPDLTQNDFGPRGRGDFRFGQDDLEQADFLQFYEADSFLDVPLGEKWILKTEQTATVEDFDSLPAADRERLELETELHYRPSIQWDLYLGTQLVRRLDAGANALGTRLQSEFDYYRYDGYAGVARRLNRNNRLELVYRRVVKDYDESAGQLSDDYDEDRVYVSWRHRLSRTVQSSLHGEARWRTYEEELARDRLGFKIPGTQRERETYLAGADLVWKPTSESVLRFDLDLEEVRDPFDHYYDYTGYEIAAELRWPLPWRSRVELDGSVEGRDYPRRRFLRYGPDVRIKDYQVWRFRALLNHTISARMDVQLEYEGKQRNTNHDIEDYDVNRVLLQMVFKL